MNSKPTRRLLVSTMNVVAFSRHTGLPVLRANAAPAFRRAASSSAGSFSRQLFSMLTGASLIGIAVALFVQGDLGLPPYDVLSSAISQRAEISLGQSGWAMATFLFVVASVLGHRPGLWGIAYIFTIGLSIDAAGGLLTQPDTLAGRWLFVVAAILLLASGVNLVVHSGTTGGPFELLMKAGEDRGIPGVAVRYGMDIGVFGVGVMLGGSFGPATVMFALTFGMVLRLIGQALVDHGAGRRLRIAVSRQSGETSEARRQISAQPRERTDLSRRPSGRRLHRSGV